MNGNSKSVYAFFGNASSQSSTFGACKRCPRYFKTAQYDLVILETSGIGQSDTEILEHSDASLYVMTPEYETATQLEKIDMLDFADLIAINKFDKRGSLDALRDVKQYQRNHQYLLQCG